MPSGGAQAADFVRVLVCAVRGSGRHLGLTCCEGIGWEPQEQMLAGLQAGRARA